MRHLAVDIGATGGKVYAGSAASDQLTFEEVHRFDNRPIERDGRWVWNIDGLLEGVVDGILKAADSGDVTSIGVDTMGVDFGLFDDGELIQEPYAYRDPTVSSTREEMLDVVDKRAVFEATGLNHWNAKNSLWQYHYFATQERDVLDRADTLVNMPQVVSTLLGGRPCAEVTVSSTTQMLDPRTNTWATGLLNELNLPTDPLSDIENPGTNIGPLDHPVVDELETSPELILPPSHDTAAAVMAMPLTDSSRAFLSTGTVFIMGVELDRPLISDEAFDIGASNEVGVDGTIRFLKNLNNGFFLIEECRHAWRNAGKEFEYEEIIPAAATASEFRSIVDPESEQFDTVGDMPSKIHAYCERTDQPHPRDEGEMTRAILEGLALKTSLILEEIFDVTGTTSDVIHLGGGGVRNELFCEMVATATDRTVLAGPSDAAAIGNILTQARSFGEIESLEACRDLVRETADLDRYEPDSDSSWEQAKDRLRELERIAGRQV